MNFPSWPVRQHSGPNRVDEARTAFDKLPEDDQADLIDVLEHGSWAAGQEAVDFMLDHADAPVPLPDPPADPPADPPTGPPADPPADEPSNDDLHAVLTGTVPEVIDYAENHPALAGRLGVLERARAKPRITLLDDLDRIAES